MVGQVARRLPSNVQRDDLLAAGVYGLVDSLRRNGGDGGAGFAWYARLRIRGAIVDELRAQDWLSRRARTRLAGQGGETVACFASLDDIAANDDEGLLGAVMTPSSSPRPAPYDAPLRTRSRSSPTESEPWAGRHYPQGARLKDIGAELWSERAQNLAVSSRAPSNACAPS